MTDNDNEAKENVDDVILESVGWTSHSDATLFQHQHSFHSYTSPLARCSDCQI